MGQLRYGPPDIKAVCIAQTPGRCIPIAMEKDQEQITNNEVGSQGQGEQQGRAEVAAEDSQVSATLKKIVIETYNDSMVDEAATIDRRLGQSQMTEAGVRRLGYSLENGRGERERSLTLLLSAPGKHHLHSVTFSIVAEATHDIVLNGKAADTLLESSRGENFPVFAVPG